MGNEIINKETGEIIAATPAAKAAIKLISAKAAAVLAKKSGAFDQLEQAELIILECQRDIAAEYQATFEHGNNQWTGQNGPLLRHDDWCNALGTSRRTVNRWVHKYLDPEKFAAEQQLIHRKIRQILEAHQAASFSSESEEWYTPAKYFEGVHAMFIPDLDPASNEFANKTVKAGEFWTREDNEKNPTLDREWFGHVFCNPPYGKDPVYGSLAGAFCNKAISEYQLGNVKECILLINSLHSQNWQAPLFNHAVCLVNHRIQFIKGDGTENKSPTMQNMFVYLGNRRQAFKSAFAPFGYVMEAIQ